jgi:hypothetical protein
MGTMTFLLPADFSADAARELERAAIAGGPDSMPWPTRTRVEPGRLLLQREVEESGFLVTPWELEGGGQLMLNSATLMERPAPYHCQLELARGKLNQVRCQAADWEAGGLELPADLMEQIHKSTLSFAHAVSETDPVQTSVQAQRALEQTAAAADSLTRLYIKRVFDVRHEQQLRLDTGFGCRVAQVPDTALAAALRPACNSICLPVPWRLIEPNEGGFQWQPYDALVNWAVSQELVLTGGPIIDFSPAQLPDWLWLYERDASALTKFLANFLAATLRRYRKRIRRWQLTAGSNSASLLGLGEEELLWLTMRLAQVARQVDPGLELIVGIAQPWGEYMAVEDRTQSPFIFADTLIRSELNLAALDVELLMGVSPRGSYCRDLLETSRLLDLYALLGVPLRLTLGLPSAAVPSTTDKPEQWTRAGKWHGDASPTLQAEWASAFAALAACKSFVQAVHWVQLTDAGEAFLPHCGLFDKSDKPKPALESLSRLRSDHLR